MCCTWWIKNKIHFHKYLFIWSCKVRHMQVCRDRDRVTWFVRVGVLRRKSSIVILGWILRHYPHQGDQFWDPNTHDFFSGRSHDQVGSFFPIDVHRVNKVPFVEIRITQLDNIYWSWSCEINIWPECPGVDHRLPAMRRRRTQSRRRASKPPGAFSNSPSLNYNPIVLSSAVNPCPLQLLGTPRSAGCRPDPQEQHCQSRIPKVGRLSCPVHQFLCELATRHPWRQSIQRMSLAFPRRDLRRAPEAAHAPSLALLASQPPMRWVSNTQPFRNHPLIDIANSGKSSIIFSFVTWKTFKSTHIN